MSRNRNLSSAQFTTPEPRIFECGNCSGEHHGTYSHHGEYDNREYFAVDCDKDSLTDHYNTDWPNRPVDQTPPKAPPPDHDYGLQF